MTNFRFLSDVCAEHLQACVPIQLLSRNPCSSVLLGAALRFFVAAAFAIGAPPRPQDGFFCERSQRSQADIIPLPEGGTRAPWGGGTGSE